MMWSCLGMQLVKGRLATLSDFSCNKIREHFDPSAGTILPDSANGAGAWDAKCLSLNKITKTLETELQLDFVSREREKAYSKPKEVSLKFATRAF